MKYFLKSYKSMTGLGYRMIMLLVLPVLFLGVAAFCGTQDEFVKFIAVPFLIMGLLVVDFYSDTMFLGGICNKDIRCIRLVQVSFDGMRVLRNAIISDCLRRAVLLIGGSVLVAVWIGEKEYVLLGVAGYLAETVMLNMSRYVSEVMFQVFFGSLLFAIMTVVMACIWFLSVNAGRALWSITGIMAILAIIATIGTIYHMVYRIGGSRNV